MQNVNHYPGVLNLSTLAKYIRLVLQLGFLLLEKPVGNRKVLKEKEVGEVEMAEIHDSFLLNNVL